jgi:hypothetical protein
MLKNSAYIKVRTKLGYWEKQFLTDLGEVFGLDNISDQVVRR